jgi:hypothetical protein
MYTFSYDKATALLVGLFTKQDAGPVDFDRQLEAMRRLDEDALLAGKAPSYVLVIDANYPAPDASTRKRLAAEWGALRSPTFAAAAVPGSAEHRGAMRAVLWLLPAESSRRLTLHDDFEEAARWLGSLRGRPLGRLHALFHETRSLAPSLRKMRAALPAA